MTLSYATGNVTGSNPGGAQSTGGLVGDNQGGTVSLSYATGNVSGERDTGGLVGRNYGGGLVTQSYATGAVTGSVYNPGGLVGYNEYTGTITYSYALGAVSLVTTSFGTPHWAGGLVGWNNGKVIQSYATGKLTADDLVNQFAGGLVGNVGDGSVAQSFWDMTTTGLSVGFGTASGSGSFSATAIQSSNPAGANYAYGVSTYSTSGWNFGTSPNGATNDCSGACWVIVDSKGTFNNDGGSTGATRPFLLSEYSTAIGNSHELQLAALDLGGNYTLAKNIDIGPALAPNVFGYPSMWSSAGFVPIGNATGFPTPTGIPFSGTFDGKNFVISNLVINRPAASGLGDYVGLFGFNSGTIQNLGVIGATITGGDFAVGTLVGYNATGSTITRSYVTGVSGTVTASTAGGVDTGYVGGMVGLNKGSISQAFADVTVTGFNYVGELVGSNHGVVFQAYAWGNVSGNDSVGGLAGYNWNGPGFGTMTQTYATGLVSGNTRVGGLLGTIDGGSVTQSYWDTTTTGRLSGLGGTVVTGTFLATGLTTSEMWDLTTATSTPQTTYIGWDFQTGWSPPNQSGQGGNATPHYPQLYGVDNNVVWVNAAASRVYGDANPTFTANYYGLNSGDMLTAAFSLTTAATSASNVGTYAINFSPMPANLTGASSTVYRAVYTGTLTVGPRPITVTADAQTKVYGDADPALTLTTSSLGTGVAVNGLLTRGAGETVAGGPYAITQGTVTNGNNPNYTITYVGANLTIDQRPITVTADAQTKVYGDADPALTLTTSSLGTGVAVNGLLTRGAGETVAGGPYAITQGTVTNGNNPNYAITYVGANLTIDQRPITVTADAQTKVYGDADPALTLTTSSLGTGVAVNGLLTRGAGETVAGGPYAITQGTVTNGNNPNYTITYVGANLTIDQRPIAVTADASRRRSTATPIQH